MKKKIGELHADCGENKPKIGVLFEDTNLEGELRFSIKIDTLPIQGSGWNGWVNVWKTKNSQGDGQP